ncbi:MAG: YcaO-like family protein [Opitutales bacterium]
MFSLGILRYRSVMEVDGGPIARLEQVLETTGDTDEYSAFAYLREGLPASRTHGDEDRLPDGAGTHRSASRARFMAVSEALERWAHRTVQSESPDAFGYDVDPSSTGMAAFPGMHPRQARSRAFKEAVERQALLLWWEHRIPHRHIPLSKNGRRAIELVHNLSKTRVVVTWRSEGDEGFSIGFSYGRSLVEAVTRASIEQDRSWRIVEQTKVGKGTAPLHSVQPEGSQNRFSRRIRFYSSPEGFESFLRRLQEPCKASAASSNTLVFDGPIKGDWSRYADVWRVLYKPPTQDHLSERSDYLYW